MLSNPQNSSRYDVRFWLITLSALAMCSLTASLGLWQLERASQKEKLTENRANLEIIRLSGQWAAEKTVYIDNRQMKGKQGFFVVTPLMTTNSEYLLVERGWIPRDFMDRRKLQAIETPVNPITIDARRMDEPVTVAVFAKEKNTEYPIVQFLDVGAIAKAMPDKVYKGTVQQLGSPSEGLIRSWYEPASGAEKNYGYAFQWFALCALCVVLYVWFQWIKKNEQN